MLIMFAFYLHLLEMELAVMLRNLFLIDWFWVNKLVKSKKTQSDYIASFLGKLLPQIRI